MAINESKKCSHCDGSGVCPQSSFIGNMQRPLSHNNALEEMDVYDTTSRLFKKTTCRICDETSELYGDYGVDIDSFRQKPDQLTCKVCGGSGYAEEIPYLTKLNIKKGCEDDLDFKK